MVTETQLWIATRDNNMTSYARRDTQPKQTRERKKETNKKKKKKKHEDVKEQGRLASGIGNASHRFLCSSTHWYRKTTACRKKKKEHALHIGVHRICIEKGTDKALRMRMRSNWKKPQLAVPHFPYEIGRKRSGSKVLLYHKDKVCGCAPPRCQLN